MVIWVIGLAGSGKTTVANMLCDAFRAAKKPVVLLDGDNVRVVFGNDLGFTKRDRLINARRIRNLCYLLDQQGMNVVCAILSILTPLPTLTVADNPSPAPSQVSIKIGSSSLYGEP